MEILSKPGLSHKIVGALKNQNPDAKIFRKSGTWRDFDAAVEASALERAQ